MTRETRTSDRGRAERERSSLLWRTVAGFAVELLGLVIIVITSLPLLLTGVLLVGIGGYAILTGGGNIRRTMTLFMLFIVMGAGANALRRGLRDRGPGTYSTTTRAVVLDTGRTRGRMQGEKRWIEYRYTVDGITYTSREPSIGYLPGDTILIRYAPAEPSASRPVEPRVGR